MVFSLLRLACAASFLSAALAQITLRSEAETVSASVDVDSLDFSDAAGVSTVTSKGITYGCKCYPGESCWPSASKWRSLNATVDGRLLVHIPPAAACHNTFTGPLGTVNTYDAAKCAEVTQNWESESWTAPQPRTAPFVRRSTYIERWWPPSLSNNLRISCHLLIYR
ncbi:hypothetical protein N658DRAFT_500531 [Parathielavia hyrcaniae]|uniref:Uncharacterized protein n=1 Tax=Parathielavia hyrcaniae TaxID=113614 RepID=A0AAN6SXS7_9PEZI|nr:hypothetical protein N658DRAFT_500531 [Parathielavia hyrcaniae]